MIESLTTHFGESSPLLILVGSFIDVFFITGYIFYGLALLGTAVILYSSGMISITTLYLMALIGTTVAGYVNYAIGYFFGSTAMVQRISNSKKAEHIKEKLTTTNLVVVMITFRSITFLRPSYMLILGAMQISPRKVIFYETIICIGWVAFWLGVLVFGEQAVMFVTKLLLSII